MKALILNCTLKHSPQDSSTEAVSKLFASYLNNYEVESEIIRIVDHNVLPGVSSNEGEDDGWPQIRNKIVKSDILILASPTWVGRMSSVAQRVVERMDAFLDEKDDYSRPVAYNHVAGFISTGNEDGAKHVIGEMIAALVELGFSVPGQSWTYYNQGSPMGPPYLDNENQEEKKRTKENAERAAKNVVALAQALNETPFPPAED